ncbi:MAG: phospholipase D-like domain-containing protein [Candidatus Bathyarchaeia archaeon]|jgi:phosphatidylserine/phosphatidylglycerophosphate/cardiolipin synthase-like enzyme
MSDAESNGFWVRGYGGDGAVLLAFDLDEGKTEKLAGFAIKCVTPQKGPYPTNEYFLPNRLSFGQKLTRSKRVDASTYVGSDKAPFQMFHWVHFPSAGPGKYSYTVYLSYFKNNGAIELGANRTAEVSLSYRSFPGLELGFTRGYVSSQAYADRFQNKPIVPTPKSIDFDTTSYISQYQWLGAHARKIIFDFLQECQTDPSISVDVFSYDFNEPDVIRELSKLGKRVRVFQDNAPLHVKKSALEPRTIEALKAAGANVKVGHFNRFAHDKVLIQKKNGKACKVLTGSANFSVRGLYVQANSVLVFDDPDVAGLYELAFQQAFDAENKFKSSQIASKWYDISKNNLPALSVSFAPHTSAFSLVKVGDAINSARSSVLFAIMEMGGKGPVMSALKALGGRKGIVSLGTIESASQLKLFKPGIDANSAVVSFDFLKKDVPEPFKTEWSGGAGQVIHHKFVVCDFNDQLPVAFCGSSNLSQGGEESNGDNLIAIQNAEVATAYAVEAIRLFDHYRFRSLHQKSSAKHPLALQANNDWVKPYYDNTNMKFSERKLLIGAHN